MAIVSKVAGDYLVMLRTDNAGAVFSWDHEMAELAKLASDFDELTTR